MFCYILYCVAQEESVYVRLKTQQKKQWLRPHGRGKARRTA